MPGIKEDEPNEGEEASEFDKEFSVEDFVEPKLISEDKEKDCETGEDIVENILIVISAIILSAHDLTCKIRPLSFFFYSVLTTVSICSI